MIADLHIFIDLYNKKR